jgi:hypothetical protein
VTPIDRLRAHFAPDVSVVRGKFAPETGESKFFFIRRRHDDPESNLSQKRKLFFY